MVSLELDRYCNFAFMGDSTLPGIVNPLREFFAALDSIPYAPRFGSPTYVFGRGKTIYEIFNISPIDSSKANIMIFKGPSIFRHRPAAYPPAPLGCRAVGDARILPEIIPPFNPLFTHRCWQTGKRRKETIKNTPPLFSLSFVYVLNTERQNKAQTFTNILRS